jgi:hypothetical protein
MEKKRKTSIRSEEVHNPQDRWNSASTRLVSIDLHSTMESTITHTGWRAAMEAMTAGVVTFVADNPKTHMSAKSESRREEYDGDDDCSLCLEDICEAQRPRSIAATFACLQNKLGPTTRADEGFDGNDDNDFWDLSDSDVETRRLDSFLSLMEKETLRVALTAE